MAEEAVTTTGIARHGAARLPSVDVDTFNIELKDEEGFLGDRASKGAFRKIFDRWRKPLRKTGKDPFGDESSETISKKTLDAMLVGDDTEAADMAETQLSKQRLASYYDTFRCGRWRWRKPNVGSARQPAAV